MATWLPGGCSLSPLRPPRGGPARKNPCAPTGKGNGLVGRLVRFCARGWEDGCVGLPSPSHASSPTVAVASPRGTESCTCSVSCFSVGVTHTDGSSASVSVHMGATPGGSSAGSVSASPPIAHSVCHSLTTSSPSSSSRRPLTPLNCWRNSSEREGGRLGPLSSATLNRSSESAVLAGSSCGSSSSLPPVAALAAPQKTWARLGSRLVCSVTAAFMLMSGS